MNPINILILISIPIFLVFGAGVYIWQILFSAGLVVYSVYISKAMLSPPLPTLPPRAWPYLLLIKDPLVLSVLVFFLYALSSSAWSISPELSQKIARNILLMFMLFLAGRYSSRQLELGMSKKIAASGVLIFASFVIVEIVFNYPITRFTRDIFSLSPIFQQPMDKGMAFASLMTAVMLPFLEGKTKWPLIVLLAVAYFVQPMQAAMLSLGLMVLVYHAALKWPRLMAKVMLLALICALFLLPLFFHLFHQLDSYAEMVSKLPQSWQERMAMWVRAYDIISLKPYLGFGFVASRDVEGFIGSEVVFQNHPHNMILQVWIELGLVGVLCLLAVMVSAFRKILALEPEKAAMWLSLISAYAVFALVSFSAWKEWWVASMLVAVQYGLLVTNSNSKHGV